MIKDRKISKTANNEISKRSRNANEGNFVALALDDEMNHRSQTLVIAGIKHHQLSLYGTDGVSGADAFVGFLLFIYASCVSVFVC